MPKRRPRLGKNGRVYTPRESRDYEELVALVARPAFKEPYLGPVSLQVQVYLSRPGGDLDNYVKSIQDGLNGIAWRDDRQVEKLVADVLTRRGQKERVNVTVERLCLARKTI